MQDKSHKIERTAATIRLKIKTSKTKVMRINNKNNAPIIQFKKVDGLEDGGSGQNQNRKGKNSFQHPKYLLLNKKN